MSKKTKECSSCAMPVPNKAEICPICGHSFQSFSLGMRVVAILLVLLMVLFLIL
ncbi:MAG: hypothetical protein LAT68_06905 [Cyclobacteriaceae bacterium]|nr:hypothetical protein [Cyclobacteriaceae bacterium]MCH8516042.1 hypothetical protein [Cyclobacteriaceae bacterium]